MIQDEISICLEVKIFNFEKKVQVSDCERLLMIKMFESPELSQIDFCLWGWMKGKIYIRKVGYTQRISRSHFRCPDEQKTIFARELRSELRLTVGVSNFYCEVNNFFIFV